MASPEASTATPLDELAGVDPQLCGELAATLRQVSETFAEVSDEIEAAEHRVRRLQLPGHDYRARRVARLRGRLYEAHQHVDGLHRRFPETRHSLPADAPERRAEA